MNPKLTVNGLIKDAGKKLSLSAVSGEDGLDRAVKVPEINRLGLALAGHFAYFAAERVQVLGVMEYSYLETISAENRAAVFRQMFISFPQMPCIIQTRNPKPFEELVELCREFSIPLLKTEMRTSGFLSLLGIFLEDRLAPSVTIHGVLVDVFGLGVLILGDSGIGKSECALELLKRGHMFIADDVIEIKLLRGGTLAGTAQELIKHFMEVRGLGIIDIKAIFSIGVILDRTTIELVVKLEELQAGKEYDRLGMEEKTVNILGVNVSQVTIPVRQGRNLAVLVEIAALNQRLKQKGYYSAKELNNRLIEYMAAKEKSAGGGQGEL